MSKTAEASYLMVITTFIWGGNVVINKLAVKTLDPYTIGFTRSLLSAVILFIIAILSTKKILPKREDLSWIFIMGLSTFLNQLLFTQAVTYTSAINVSLIMTSSPILTSVLSIFLLKEKLNFRIIWVSLIIMVSILIGLANGDLNIILGLKFNYGDILMIAAMLMLGVNLIAAKKIIKKYGPLLITFYTFLGVLFFYTILYMFSFKEITFRIINMNSFEVAGILYMAVLSTCVGSVLNTKSNELIGPTKTTMFMCLMPIFSSVFSNFFLGEVITPIKLLSLIVVTLAMFYNTKKELDYQARLLKR